MWESVCESGVKERASVIVCVKERVSMSESDVNERVNEGRGQRECTLLWRVHILHIHITNVHSLWPLPSFK